MSATLPARLGEPARALVALAADRPHARDVPRPRRHAGLADAAQHRRPAAARRDHRLDHAALPLQHPEDLRLQLRAARAAARPPRRADADAAQRQRPPGQAGRGACTARWSRSAPASPSSASPAAGSLASAAQLGAWAIQLAACWALLAALGSRRPGRDRRRRRGPLRRQRHRRRSRHAVEHRRLPVRRHQRPHTPAGGSAHADALAYGVILQAVEIATAVALGLPSLVREGLTWSDLRVQALSASPVRLQPKPPPRGAARETV